MRYDSESLRGLQRDLSVFSPDSIEMLKHSSEKNGLRSRIIDILIRARDNLLTHTESFKFNAIKQDLVVYVGKKITQPDGEVLERDPWIILKDHIAGGEGILPEQISEHLQDCLKVAYLIANYEFAPGAAEIGAEILELKQDIDKTYLPLITQIPDDVTKKGLIAELASLSALLESMGSLTKQRKYKDSLEVHERIQVALQNSCEKANAWLAERHDQAP